MVEHGRQGTWTWRRWVRLATVAALLAVPACGDDGDDGSGMAAETSVPTTSSTGTTPTTGTTVVNTAGGDAARGPALDDWDGRRYDVGTVSGARPADGGWVVDFDRYGLTTVDPDGDLRDPDAFSTDPVEPWSWIVNLSDFPFTNTNDQLRDLTVTEAAWLFEVVEEDVRCPGDEGEPDPALPPWREADLEGWISDLGDPGPLVLLTYDALGTVVQIRPMAGC